LWLFPLDWRCRLRRGGPETPDAIQQTPDPGSNVRDLGASVSRVKTFGVWCLASGV
jgi:hypothetical protein